MNPHQEVVEREAAFDRNHDLAVDNKLLRLQLQEARHDFWKVSSQRLAALRLQVDLRAIAKSDAAEAVPLRLVLPVVTSGVLLNRLRFHRQVRLFQRQRHAFKSLRSEPSTTP